ncbi:hypothetical protein U9M48_032992 [Paspalum notatum var. saurae]|uniref:Secreted protein n=1 Tax=Paspalum notatum var. saurae TaxID=547442 RepID=A0AAQ3U6F0_PASNO
MSSLCRPLSATLPLFTTAIMSAFCTVERRCATTTHVLPCSILSMASCTSFSDTVSSALVASSSSSTRAFFSTARASAIRCRCPPDSCAPRSPTRAS